VKSGDIEEANRDLRENTGGGADPPAIFDGWVHSFTLWMSKIAFSP